jgi:hypothetical protein
MQRLRESHERSDKVRQIGICESSGNSRAYDVFRKFQKNKLLKVSDVAVLKWARNFAKSLECLKNPPPVEGVIVVFNEKPNKVDLEGLRPKSRKNIRLEARKTRRVDLEGEIEINGRDFITDDNKTYNKLIPEAQLSTGKDLTYPIEQAKQ